MYDFTFPTWRFITRWLPGQVEAVFLCKVWSSMGIWFSYNVYPKFYKMCHFWSITFCHFSWLSLMLVFWIFKPFINRTNLQKCSPASETWKVLTDQLDRYETIFWILQFIPLIWELNDLYVRILKRFSNEVRQNKAKNSLPATKSRNSLSYK